MEDKRAKTLEALSEFIKSQKALLKQTQDDIARLRELRNQIVEDDGCHMEGIMKKLALSSLRLSEQPGLTPSIAREIDWGVFRSYDPSPFKDLASTLRRVQGERSRSSLTQSSPLSPLQQFVKDQRAVILDPILPAYGLFAERSASDEDDALDPEELRRQREREKIRELKKRRIDRGQDVPLVAGLRRPRTVNGVFIRRDQEDESGEVEISADGDTEGETSALGPGQHGMRMEVDTPPTSVVSSVSTYSGLPPVASSEDSHVRVVRERKPSRKAQARETDVSSSVLSAKGKRKRDAETKVAAAPEAERDVDGEEQIDAKQNGKKKEKPKSETYKQAWSVSEQHLLERLLEEIPEGEKNRWAKISKAMNGRRTARQVASRVQKYFEKLKRFGVEVGGRKSIPPRI
ncbi:uncharacterized protein LAESUDRAFT_697585 [Laetiporus sulphureus 93-53]|uniref:Uncharacterized protein n=1 Tax=Laetiporus sulphureus 93-53 TaxID=1314785 RepID=A0A165F0P7_9APHY|nr:uncharacterized protein LAESUDRAFT_697585 [Laetiporus sulphureus 93-53]KZT08119.1 hypothetical protein LAESUDRAFT_697585 [Laetiporus sulphureus 93-53]